MKHKVVFEFDDASITEVTPADIQAQIELLDGRVIILPKLKGIVYCGYEYCTCTHDVYDDVLKPGRCTNCGKPFKHGNKD